MRIKETFCFKIPKKLNVATVENEIRAHRSHVTFVDSRWKYTTARKWCVSARSFSPTAVTLLLDLKFLSECSSFRVIAKILRKTERCVASSFEIHRWNSRFVVGKVSRSNWAPLRRIFSATTHASGRPCRFVLLIDFAIIQDVWRSEWLFCN